MKYIGFYSAVALLLVILILVFVFTKKSHEGFKKCVCSSREENCQDVDLVDKLYTENILTEYSTLKSPGWDRGASPGSYDFPEGTCGSACNKQKIHVPVWKEWDFTDFGSSAYDCIVP